MHGQRCSSGRIEALWSPFTWRCKREPAWRRAGKVRAAPLAWRRKRCGSSSAGASIMGLIRRCEYLGPIRGCKCCGSSFIGVLALWFILYVGLQVPCSSFMLRYQRRGSFFAWECQSGNEKLQGREGHYEHGAAFGGVECRYRAIETLNDFLHDGQAKASAAAVASA